MDKNTPSRATRNDSKPIVSKLWGTIYLIHFSDKLKHAQHYIGFTTDLPERLKCHQGKNGSKLMNAVNENRIPWLLVRTWNDAPQSFERELKMNKNAPKLCPICSGEKAFNRKNFNTQKEYDNQ